MTAAAFDHARDYIEEALVYIEDILDGTIPACKWVKLACKRQMNDLRRAAEGDADFPYRFDARLASKVCAYIENLHHIKGEWAMRKERIRLEPWQIFQLTTLFGWVHVDTGLRRFREVYDEVARKNAKTTLAAGVLLYMFTEDGEAGAEVYAAATKKDQANIVFGAAREMVRRNADLRNHYNVTAHEYKMKRADSSEAKALDAKGSTQDGLNPHCCINDELHAWKGRALYEVIRSALGARQQPLIFNITTAGFDRSGICYEKRTYACRVLEGRVTDETYFAIIYTLDEGDDWLDESVWIKSNPNLGVSVYLDGLRKDANEAKEMIAQRNGFLTKRLNIWCNAATAWMDMDAWDACADPDLKPADCAGMDCIAALDLATKKDISSRIRWFVDQTTGMHYLFARHYLPRAAVERGENASYDAWEQQGWLTVTEGQVTDQSVIQADLLTDLAEARCDEVVFDRYQAGKMMAELEAEGLVVVDLSNTVANMSEPMKELEALVLDRKMAHQGDPVLTWMISNVCARLDEKDNIFPIKETKDSKNKIDGAVAAIMGLNRVMAQRDHLSPWDRDPNFSIATNGKADAHVAVQEG